VSKRTDEGNYFLGEVARTHPNNDTNKFQFSGSYRVDNVDLEVKAFFDAHNYKGNLQLFLGQSPFLNSLVVVDPSHILMFKLHDNTWVEINIGR